MISELLKKAKWVDKTTLDENWLKRKVVNPVTGNEVEIGSLPAEERDKFKPLHWDKDQV